MPVLPSIPGEVGPLLVLFALGYLAWRAVTVLVTLTAMYSRQADRRQAALAVLRLIWTVPVWRRSYPADPEPANPPEAVDAAQPVDADPPPHRPAPSARGRDLNP